MNDLLRRVCYHLLFHAMAWVMVVMPVVSFIVSEVPDQRSPSLLLEGFTVGAYGIVLFIRLVLLTVFSWKNLEETEKAFDEKETVIREVRVRESDNLNMLFYRNRRVYCSIVGYKEEPDFFRSCILSAMEQERAFDKIFICVDGLGSEISENQRMIDIVKDTVKENLVHIEVKNLIIPKENHRQVQALLNEHHEKKVFLIEKAWAGKRAAIHTNLTLMSLLPQDMRPEWVFLTDSDSVLDKKCSKIMISTAQMYENKLLEKSVGAVGGHVRIDTDVQKVNRWSVLVFLQSMRYFAFRLIEAGAQSWFGCIFNVPGPCGFFNYNALMEVLTEWIDQTYCGKRSTYGDDTHFTKLLEERGYATYNSHLPYVSTQCPQSWVVWISQQTRWTKSGIREFAYMQRFVWKLPVFIQFDYLSHFFFSIVITGFIFYLLIWGSIMQWVLFFVVVNTVSLFKALILVVYMVRLKVSLLNAVCGALGFSLYGLVYLLVLVPVRIQAFLTQCDVDWGTVHTERCIGKNVRQSLFVLLWIGVFIGKTVFVFYGDCCTYSVSVLSCVWLVQTFAAILASFNGIPV